MEAPPPRNPSQGRSPTRPSFEAPTKASLARSNPEVLERALSRSPTRRSMSTGGQDGRQGQVETRGFGLRDRKALRPSLPLTASPSNSLNRESQSPRSFATRRSSGLAAFAAPPRRVSKRISASDFQFQSPTAMRVTQMELSVTNTPEDQLASELGSATGVTDLNGDFDAPSFHDGFDEPDLPPTPTQLGLEQPPGRPKGLLSSSPSMSQGKWKRRAPSGLDQSPSKLRSVEYGAELEDSARRSPVLDEPLLPETIHKKRKLKQELSTELESLKQDIAKLEGLSKKLDQLGDNMEPYLNDLISLLAPTDTTHTSTNTRSTDTTISSLISTLLPFSTRRPPKPRQKSPEANPFALDQKAQTESYLSALAPLKLSASSTVIPPLDSSHLLEEHTLTLTAPRPFPPKLYDVSITYETNPETQSLVSLSVNQGSVYSDSKIPVYLQQWITTRLANPLLKLDVSGLCWGINRYWEAMISRAQIWAHLEDQHSKLLVSHTGANSTTPCSDKPTNILTVSDLRHILPHLERTSMLFESRPKSLRVIVTCELRIDEWTSEPELTPSICVSTTTSESDPSATNSLSSKVEQESKKLFQAILSENTDNHSHAGTTDQAQTIIRATGCILSALLGG